MSDHPLFDRLDFGPFAEQAMQVREDQPELWDAFVSAAERLRAESGGSYMSAKHVAERVRQWARVEKKGEWKVNNNIVSAWARMLAWERPQTFGRMFRFRERKAS